VPPEVNPTEMQRGSTAFGTEGRCEVGSKRF